MYPHPQQYQQYPMGMPMGAARNMAAHAAADREPLQHTKWQNVQFLTKNLNPAQVLDIFCNPTNPFYDPHAKNEHAKMQRIAMESIVNTPGTEYTVMHWELMPPPFDAEMLYIICKQERTLGGAVRPLAYYYVIGQHVHISPDISSILNFRLSNVLHHLKAAFGDTAKEVEYDPTKGFKWLFDSKLSPTKSTENGEEPVCDSDEVKMKSTRFQQMYVEQLLNDLTERFPLPQPEKDGQNSGSNVKIEELKQETKSSNSKMGSSASPPPSKKTIQHQTMNILRQVVTSQLNNGVKLLNSCKSLALLSTSAPAAQSKPRAYKMPDGYKQFDDNHEFFVERDWGRVSSRVNYWATWFMQKDYLRRKQVAAFWPTRTRLVALKKNRILPQAFRDQIADELHSRPNGTNHTWLKPLCQLTGRKRGNVRRFRMSRHMFRRLSDKGKMSGVQWAMW